MPKRVFTNNYNDSLAFAKELADDARTIAMRYYKTNLQFVTKSDKSPVTVADKEINQLVIDRVKQHFPEYGVLGEEQSWHADREYLWVCDPIDGTIAFSMGEPTFMFSLALVKDGQPAVAVAADLASGGTFWAIKGGGAHLDNKEICVSSRTVNESWLAFPTNLEWLYKGQSIYKLLDSRVYQTNIIHGGVFKGVLVAQGLSDGAFWPDTIHPWDMAAVKLLVEEAGGKLTDASGSEHRFDRELTGGLVISNGIIHQDLIDTINTVV